MREITKKFLARGAFLAGFAFLSLLAGAPADAQNLFAPAAYVNDTVITEFEVQQRQRFLQILNVPDATREAALDALIDDRLRARAAADAGIELSDEQIIAGLDEFSSRADLSRQEFIAALGQAGVSEETFRDFVVTNTAWRDLIRALYNPRVQISESEIDRALGSTGGRSGLRVLLSEIIIPAPPPRAAEAAAIAERVAKSNSIEQFSAFARQYSATASRDQGGKLPWSPLEQLPPAIQPLIMALSPGEVTAPLPIPGGIAFFQLRDIEETGRARQEYSAIEYAVYHIPGGRSPEALARAAQIRTQVDRCDDLYGVAKGQPEQILSRVTQTPAEIPQDIAIELSKLDPGEVSTALTGSDGRSLRFLMLCSRTAVGNQEADREQVLNALRQRRLQGYSDQLLEQLRADARISRQ
ncbi:MAG: peptidylprolyl isomerase [Rhodobacteraceae bacterium]|nr:peptidylprolyl isomerase [Paracoccaceae bacterium]MBO28644.1 peptidylprolyl isomerase [Paracoccaceae bacterium]